MREAALAVIGEQHRIVLAYDGSREGRSALREGALLARKLGAQVFLLSVVADKTTVAIVDK